MRLLTAAVLLLLSAGVILLFRDTPKRPGAPRAPGSSSTLAGLHLRSTYLYVYNKSGEPEWTLTALDAVIITEQRIVRSAGIQGGKFYRGGKVVATFSAGPTVYNDLSKDLEMSGPIAVDGTNGVHLRSGSLHYSYSTKKLSAVGPLQITTAQSSFTAGQFSADLALEELTFSATAAQPVVLTSRPGPAGQL